MKFSVSEVSNILSEIKNLKSLKKESSIFENISIDSRSILGSELFVAIKGKKLDGHNFLEEVIQKGVKAVVIQEGMESLLPIDFPFWSVPNTLEAFQKLALFKRRKLKVPVIGITGSVGKTTTKEIMGEVLKKYGDVNLSYANYNNEIGLGLSILNTDDKDKILILEMGMRGIGQIENLSKFSEPDIAIITNIGSAHIGLLGSKENITYAKCEITKYLNPNGLVIIPGNDPFLEKTLIKNWKGRILKVELLDLDHKLNNKRSNNLQGFYNRSKNLIIIEQKEFELSLRGFHNAYNFMFAYAVAKEFCIDFKKFNKFNFGTLKGRNQILKSVKTTIYDETYNASPESVKACLDNLLESPNNHFFIFGSMRELGIRSEKYHKEIFDFILKTDIKICIFICDMEDQKKYEKYIKLSDKFLLTNDIKNVPNMINKYTNKGDFVLVKGSRFWRLEKIISLID